MLGRLLRNRKEFDVRSFYHFNFLCLFLRKRFDDHGIIDRIDFRLMNLCQFCDIFAQNIFCGCKGSKNGSCCRTLRTYQINLRSRVTGASLEVPVGGSHSHALGSR